MAGPPGLEPGTNKVNLALMALIALQPAGAFGWDCHSVELYIYLIITETQPRWRNAASGPGLQDTP